MTSATYPNLAKVYNELSRYIHHCQMLVDGGLRRPGARQIASQKSDEVKGKCFLSTHYSLPAGLHLGDGGGEATHPAVPGKAGSGRVAPGQQVLLR